MIRITEITSVSPSSFPPTEESLYFTVINPKTQHLGLKLTDKAQVKIKAQYISNK